MVHPDAEHVDYELYDLSVLLEESRKQARQFRVNATVFKHVEGLRVLAPPIVERAAQLLNAPMSAVTLIFAEYALVVAAVGYECGKVSLDSSYCEHVVVSRDWMAVENSLDDPRVCHNLSTTKGGIRSYLGVPLITGRGHIVGSLCVVDFMPRHWTKENTEQLQGLAEELMLQEREVYGVGRADWGAPSIPERGEQPPHDQV